MKRLSQYPARSLWRSYAPTHFGGRTGTYMGIDEEHLQDMPTRRHCEPAEHGEYWCAHTHFFGDLGPTQRYCCCWAGHYLVHPQDTVVPGLVCCVARWAAGLGKLMCRLCYTGCSHRPTQPCSHRTALFSVGC